MTSLIILNNMIKIAIIPIGWCENEAVKFRCMA